MFSEPFAWREPLDVARLAAGQLEHWLLLYSGQQQHHTGRFSYLCLYPQETVCGDSFAPLAARLTRDKDLHANAWFGYLGYELLHDVERLTHEANGFIALPEGSFTRYGMILRFDHAQKTALCFREEALALPAWLAAALPARVKQPVITGLSSSMTRERYLQSVEDTKNAISKGDFYQANITRKFTGSFAQAPDTFGLFVQLCEASPAAYSAFLRMGDVSVVSSSPERFLTISGDGKMETRPIKGTAPRLADAQADAAQRRQLEQSQKDRAENLMIVDLMRNDFAKSCVAGSIAVDNLFEVTSYATLHHMASTVHGKKRDDVSTLEAVRQCFPPGSMTGAPKIKAMKWCMEQEKIRRGIYSGALGWFGGDGSCDLSVVIRTLVVRGAEFEFQVGGGIIADSVAELEWRETLTKARGICSALGIDMNQIESL